ncbi:peptidoglycan-binding protein LysM [Lactobacillus rodentium]|uniref:aggregation-promoting factor n=1 Tax=Lactobacillus rodentium TaxID=947835 RepID=UPI001472914A|nr:peptidoglycan-binding protein LysM [Lactobacillus rodentium]MCR1894451.1 peptidoglycan-binding protein LysM [Lactobacillus rodentium]
MTKGEFSLNKFKSTLVKLSAGIAIAFSGLVAVNTVGTNSHVQAATTAVTINYVPGYGIAVWSNYQGGHTTGQYLKHGNSYKVIATATDAQGNTWYDLGLNQWIMAKYTIDSAKVATASTQAISSSEQAAKNWIANRESGGSYTARNGQYVGKYQLSASYLHGDYSPANQERVADNYVKSRYGSWVNAKNFWLSHGWY